MKNLYNRQGLDEATIPVKFDPKTSRGFEDIRGEYHAGSNISHSLIVENGKIAPRYAVNFLYPQNDSIRINAEFFHTINGNPSELGLLLDVIFAAKGLHTSSNDKVNVILKSLADNISDLPECILDDKQMYRQVDLMDYVFDTYYRNTTKMLRVYNIPKQGYLDFEI